MGADRTLGSGGALQRGHSASLEPLAQHNDALSGGNKVVTIVVVPANTVATEPGGNKHSSVDGRHKGEHLGLAAHSNEVKELPLSPSHSAMMPTALNLSSSS